MPMYASTEYYLHHILALMGGELATVMAPLPPGTNILGQVYGNGNVISVKPILSLTAYDANDAVGGLLTFPNAAKTDGGCGMINTLIIVDHDNEKADLELWLYSRAFTPTANHAAFAPSDADNEFLVGVIAIPTASYKSANSNGEITIPNIGIEYKITYTGTSLFGQLKCIATPTYSSPHDLTVKLGVTYINSVNVNLPSPSASASPSGSLSPSASGSPSASPSASPSGSASASPSMSPSVSPSVSPSASMSPSVSPSVSPSASMSPSVSPSASASVSPSASPSTSPSISPSESPSVSPSVSPSASGSPSASPSASASESPSVSPSASSSVSPSVSPSASGSPSASPSTSRSESPSRSPSASPSASRSLSPSSSASPSASPSVNP